MSQRACSAAFGLALVLVGCGGGGGSAPSTSPSPGSNPAPTIPPIAEYSIAGAVQKGPFIVGSLVLVNDLTSTGKPTNSTLTTEIKDSIGSFGFGTTRQGPVQIVAQGYYFNELTGQLSDGTLTLKSLYEVGESSSQRAYVNIMTHLINDRVLALLSTQQISFSAAIAQAEREFVAAFNPALPVTNVSRFSELNLYNQASAASGANAYLLAVSTAFYKYASVKADQFSTSADAELTFILNVLADDLAADGQIQRAGFLEEFTSAVRSLEPQILIANLRQRSIVDYPAGLDVPDISQFLSLCAGELKCAWRAGAPIPQVARSLTSAVYEGKIYIFGGVTQSKVSEEVYAYDPAANHWARRAPMPFASAVIEAEVIGDHIYVVAGYGDGGFMNQTARYSPAADSWELRAPKPTHRYEFATAAVDGRLYVMGGVGTIDNGPWESGKPWTVKDLVEIYDPVTDSWTNGAAAPMPFAGASSCLIDGNVYIFGGFVEGSAGLQGTMPVPGAYTLQFDPIQNVWTSRQAMIDAATGTTCVEVGGAAYVLGGLQGNNGSNSLRRYDPVTGGWTSPSRLFSPRYWATAAAVGEEIFLLGGMETVEAFVPDVEIFDTSM